MRPARQEHQGVKVIAFFTHGPGIVFNTPRAITQVDDLSGLKFRVGGGMVTEIFKTLGMNVTLKPAPDSYELPANQKKAVDAASGEITGLTHLALVTPPSASRARCARRGRDMTEALTGFGAIFVLALLRMPLAFAMALVGIVGMGVTRGWVPALASTAQVVHETGFAYTLSVIPLFFPIVVSLGVLRLFPGLSLGLLSFMR